MSINGVDNTAVTRVKRKRRLTKLFLNGRNLFYAYSDLMGVTCMSERSLATCLYIVGLTIIHLLKRVMVKNTLICNKWPRSKKMFFENA